MYFIIFCIAIVQSSLTCDYYREELDCIRSKLTCRWNQDVCVYTEGLNFGCSISLSFAACIQQTYYPDGTLAQCIFSGYCRKVEGVLQSCANNLSRSACLAVDDQYCLWNDSCQSISEQEAQNLSVNSVQMASVGVCRLRTDQAYVHQQGAHDILNINYKASLLTNDSNKYKLLMQIPGCLNVPDDIFTQLNCNSAGLNQQGCQLIKQQSCIFKNNLCQQVNDISQLKCSDKLNQQACLSVTMEKCSWNNNKCIEIESKNSCSYDILVSPGVCSNELNIECFYDSNTYKCNQMCRSQQMMKTETGCKQSSYNCKWEDGTCLFDSQNQCGKNGQNKYSCMIADQQCRFINGQCVVVSTQTLLDQLKCVSGLNKISCLYINNPSQVCQFNSQQCQLIQITPDDICDTLQNVNPNACRKVTTQACYWKDDHCETTDGSIECDTKGLNRIGCLSSTLSSCKWNEFSGVCESITINRIDKCDDQSLVNPVACRKIKGENCRYDNASNSCESFIMDNTVACNAEGLNENGCANILNTALSCRWVSNQCITVESLGGAVSCSALQSVTYRTCAYVQQSKCQYDSRIQGCITSVAVTSDCTTKGLNSYACASLSSSCYFDNANKQCKVATDLSQIACDTMYPSQTTCLAITKQGQYCLWNDIDTICQLQTFPVSQPCTNYTLVNKLFCLAYEISITKRLTYTNNYCKYSSDTKSCVSFSTIQTDCGSTLDINLHACIGLSNQTKNCYFDSTTLKCLELSSLSDSKMSSLQCKQCGKQLCSKITTSGQYCMWNTDAISKGDDKCMSVDTVDKCDKYTTSQVNPNVCAFTQQGQACKYVNDTCVVTMETNLHCSTSGLNQQGCINNTNQSCVFDKNLFCQQVTVNTATRVSCNDSVNQGGCLDSLMETCFWDNNKCNKVTIDSTITCSSLNDKLYNAIVCASITNGDKCKYNSTTHHCEVVSATTDCQTGYNQTACSTDLCDFKQNVCATRQSPQQNDCMPKTVDMDCFGVTTAACSWNGSKCNIISDLSTCANVTATGQQNSVACQMVQKDACAYDSATHKCVSVTTTNNICTRLGLNEIGCIQKTKGNLCKFTNTCAVSANNPACAPILNADACASVSGFACAFDQSTQACSQISDSDLANFSCSDYSDPSKYRVNSLVCKYADTSSTCIYDTINQVCKVDTTILTTCNQNQTINQQYCLNYVRETCQFKNYTCSSMTNFQYDCNQALSFRQCVVSHTQSCQWQNNQCNKISFSQDCITISNTNSIACMQNNYQSQQCQFKDNGMSTQCIVPLNTTSQCEGLNKLACLNNTAHACYYFDYCIDIQLIPYTAECKTGFYFTQSACVLIQNTTQKCMLSNGDCVSVNVTGSCNTYSSNVYSTQVCASITQESCYWNHGCVQGVAATCSTLGANSLACKGAIAGSCIFTNKCLDVLTDDVSQSKCSDPSNQNGCLNLYNGQTCQWSNNSCTDVTVTTGCLSYSQVNPGVCSAVTDVPCIWNSNSCAIVSVISNTCARGMNLLACVNYTSDICQFTSGMCKQITDITSIECNANLNQNACVSHSTKCCQWQNNTCIDGTAASTCNLMSTNYSKYCCMIQEGDKCTYTTTCTQLTVQNSRCTEALNKTACLWISQPCQWDDNQCSPVPNTIGCVDQINPAACIMQSSFCMYDQINYKCIDGENTKCSALQYSSKGKDCTQVTDVGCKEGQSYGCELTTISTECQSKVNQIGCLDNIQYCEWDNGTCKTAQQQQQQPQQNTNTYIKCPNTNISRGLCAQYIEICTLDSNYSCIILDTDNITNYTCIQLNSISLVNNNLCSKISVGICQYYPDEFRCGITIKSHTCDTDTILTNKFGCQFIQKDCIWNDKEGCIDLPTNAVFYDCGSIQSQYTCLHYKSTSCVWDDVYNACKEYDANTFLKCTDHTDTITSPGVCYYHSTDPCAHNGTTCYVDNGTGDCSNSKSPLGCQNNDTKCYWDIDEAICCKLIINEVPDMTCPQLRYSQQIYCTQPINEGQTCHWTNNLCLNANAQQVSCTSELSLYGCLAVAKENEQCIFTNNKCQYTNNSQTYCTDRLNIYGCVNIQQEGQFCKWLGQQCSTLTDTNFTIDKHILINQHVCRRVIDTPAKFDTSNYICIQSEDDLCDTPGLNILGCLLTINSQCDWVNNKCIEYDQTKQFTTCEEYVTVSPKVCSSITISGLKCYHNSKTLSCQTFIENTFDFTNVKTLNRLACLSITIAPTIWNGICQDNNIIKGVTQCNDLQNVNPVSCALIDVDDQICKYYIDGQCTTQFDSSIDQCDTLGLNILGCIAIENNRCQFSNNKCQYYQGSINICTNLINVNSNVCQSLTTQPCKWSYVNRGCINIYNDTCDVDGINQLGCQSLSNCTYILNQCICNGLIQLYSIIDCTQYTQDNCYQDQCIYDIDNKNCRNKICSDINIELCDQTTINQYQCYRSQLQCKQAKQCSDLFNVADCKNYKINGKQCNKDTYYNNHCIDQNCKHFTQDECSGDCMWSYYQCEQKSCTYLKKEECTGIVNNQQCFYKDECIAINSCEEYMSYIDSEQSQETQCNQQTILNKQCYWLSNQCISSLCRQFGLSSKNCNGTEVNSEVCVLLNNQCQSCNEIEDPCTCMNLSDYCYYNKSTGCQSNTCAGMSESQCSSDRCVYREKQCMQICSKLQETTCKQRTTDCHWNSNNNICLDGVEPTYSINTLSDIIVVEVSYTIILSLFLMNFIIN